MALLDWLDYLTPVNQAQFKKLEGKLVTALETIAAVQSNLDNTQLALVDVATDVTDLKAKVAVLEAAIAANDPTAIAAALDALKTKASAVEAQANAAAGLYVPAPVQP